MTDLLKQMADALQQAHHFFTEVKGWNDDDGMVKACSQALAAYAAHDTQREGKAEERQQSIVPGSMKCAKCGFGLTRKVLYVKSGTVGMGDNKTEPCPNGCGPLWPETWEQAAREAWETSERFFNEKNDATAELNRLRNALRCKICGQENTKRDYGCPGAAIAQQSAGEKK